MEPIYKEESYSILGACFEVYNQMGSGFTESVYQECLELEFQDQQIPFEPQVKLKLDYKGHRLTQFYIPDFICYSSIIIEIKALGDLLGEHRAQVHNYLKATGFRLGLLINFGQHTKLQYERIIR